MKPGTSVVFLPCSDILKTTLFYHDILKFPIAERQGDHLAIFDTGYGCWGFCEYADGRISGGVPENRGLNYGIYDQRLF